MVWCNQPSKPELCAFLCTIGDRLQSSGEQTVVLVAHVTIISKQTAWINTCRAARKEERCTPL